VRPFESASYPIYLSLSTNRKQLKTRPEQWVRFSTLSLGPKRLKVRRIGEARDSSEADASLAAALRSGGHLFWSLVDQRGLLFSWPCRIANEGKDNDQPEQEPCGRENEIH